jgi:hypothetical protein
MARVGNPFDDLRSCRRDQCQPWLVLRGELKPRNVARQPLGQRRRGRVAQLGRGPADVGVGLADIARLLGQPPDDRWLAQGSRDRVDQPPQLDRVGVPQVVEVVAPAPVDGPDDPVDDVRDEVVVAPGGAIAEHGHRLAAVDQPGEPRDGQVGAVARAVGGEEPQPGDRQAVEVVERVGEQLAGLFRRRVGADGVVDRVGLAKRGVGAVAVDARARGIDEPRAGLEPGRRLEPSDRPGHVDVGVEPRVLDAGADPRPGGDVDDHIGPRPVDQGPDPGRVADIQLDQRASRIPQRHRQVGLLGGPGIEGVEIVDDDDLGAIGQQAVDHVRSDEPGSPGHDGSHVHPPSAPARTSSALELGLERSSFPHRTPANRGEISQPCKNREFTK